MTPKIKSPAFLVAAGLVTLIITHILLSWVMSRSPFLAESYYDEAVTGEMALHILKGEHQLFFWGQPYMGSIEAYLNAVVILFVGSSAASLRLSDTLMSMFMLFLVNRIGTLAGDWKVGLLAAAYWALGPLYLSIIRSLATGGHVESCAFSAFILLSISLLVFKSSKNPVALACLIGIVAGLAWWSSLLSAPFLLAGVLILAIARPRLLLGWIPWIGLAGFLLGSFPFWLWEFLHDFSTFGFFGGRGVGIFHHLWLGLYIVLRFSLFQSFLGDWWDGHTVLPSVPSFLAWTVFILVYLPAFVLSLLIMVQWIRRIISFRNPFQGPKDLVAAAFWILILAFSTSEQGLHGSLRYSLSLYIPFTILLALWLKKVFQLRKALGAATLIGLLGFNLFLHHLFLDEFKNLPFRPVDQLIKALKDRGIRYAYADNRISQVLTFESGEKIICADYDGQRNFNYLQTVDAAPAKEVAIITHQKLGNPYPATMAASLRFLGGTYKQAEVGDYMFWYDFKEPSLNLRSLPPQDWRIIANQGQGDVGMIKDRDIMPFWSIGKKAGDYLTVDLGQPKRLGRISILPGPIGFGPHTGIRVETSRDQKKWEKIAELLDEDMLMRFHWHRDFPRPDQNPRLQTTFAPHLARYVRLTNLADPKDPKDPWTIAELFIYEVSPTPVKPSAKAVAAYQQAKRALNHWMDDPTGPHPLFPGVNLETRRRQVDWEAVIYYLEEAIQEAPDWEDAHQLLGEAIDMGGLWHLETKQNIKKPLIYTSLFPPEKRTRIPPTQFRASANTNNTEAGLAIDGNPLTRWSSLRSQEPGMSFQVDLGADWMVNGFSLFFGSSLNDNPRNLEIMGSLDGRHWQKIQASSHTCYAYAEHQIYKKVDYFFPPIRLHDLKLVQMGKDPVYWSIHEVEVFGEKG
jgi:F5/8 type C domain